jgi:methylated-DNA-[protein]-cysteine S-methyltransferase
MRVPYGELRTYGDLAATAGSPRAWRAAGHAMRVSPIELWIPCHRIVPAGPGLGTYGGHPERREHLLRLEGVI